MNWFKENWFKVVIVIILILYLIIIRQHYRAQCVADLTSQDGRSNGITRLSEACQALGYKAE